MCWLGSCLQSGAVLVNAVSNQGGVANNGHINDHNNDHIGDFHDDVTANCMSRRHFTDAKFEERVFQSQQFSESCLSNDCRLYTF